MEKRKGLKYFFFYVHRNRTFVHQRIMYISTYMFFLKWCSFTRKGISL